MKQTLDSAWECLTGGRWTVILSLELGSGKCGEDSSTVQGCADWCPTAYSALFLTLRQDFDRIRRCNVWLVSMLYSVREVQEQRGRNLVMHVTRYQDPTSLFMSRSLRSTCSSSLIGMVAQPTQLSDNRRCIRILPGHFALSRRLCLYCRSWHWWSSTELSKYGWFRGLIVTVFPAFSMASRSAIGFRGFRGFQVGIALISCVWRARPPSQSPDRFWSWYEFVWTPPASGNTTILWALFQTNIHIFLRRVCGSIPIRSRVTTLRSLGGGSHSCFATWQIGLDMLYFFEHSISCSVKMIY